MDKRLLILASGILLALSSCAGFLATLQSSDKLGIVLAAGFFVGVAATLVGVILVLVRAIRGPGTKACVSA